jgi:ferredoxin--NADP+ reductase
MFMTKTHWLKEAAVLSVHVRGRVNSIKNHKYLDMTKLSDYNIERKFPARVVETKRLTPEDLEEVREIQLEVEDPSFHCEIDQSFGVLVETKGAFGNQYHHRLYSVADLPGQINDKPHITFLVKRCNYVDDFNGELYPGIGSNYLCDRRVGDTITITGPFDLPFRLPEDKDANLILIGMGTGIAPFRAFIKHIYHHEKEWKGKIRLFYGARSGLEMLYLNDRDGDMTNYYDQETFEAIKVLSPRPHWSDPIALDKAIEDRAEDILDALSQTNTYIYVAGHKKIKDQLDKAFARILNSEEKWETRKAELLAGKKWAEVVY